MNSTHNHPTLQQTADAAIQYLPMPERKKPTISKLKEEALATAEAYRRVQAALAAKPVSNVFEHMIHIYPITSTRYAVSSHNLSYAVRHAAPYTLNESAISDSDRADTCFVASHAQAVFLTEIHAVIRNGQFPVKEGDTVLIPDGGVLRRADDIDDTTSRRILIGQCRYQQAICEYILAQAATA